MLKVGLDSLLKSGYGTNALSKLKAGDLLELIGPLGNGFPIVSGKKYY